MNGDEEQDLESSGLALPAFQSVDAVQRMISKLERVKATMMTNVGPANDLPLPDSPTQSRTFEDLSLIDISSLHFDDSDDTWLIKTLDNVATEPKADVVNSDPSLVNIRFNLLNHVKDVIKEDREVTFKAQRDDALARLKAIKSSNANTSVGSVGRVSVSNPSISVGLDKAGIVYPTISRGSDKHTVYPTISRGTDRRLHEILAPTIRDNGYNLPPSDMDQPTVRPHHYLSPSGKQIDTRTYTRPKKTRKSLSVCEDFDSHSQSNSLSEDSPAKSIKNTSRPELGLNDTFNVNEECNGTSTPLQTSVHLSPDQSPPRKVTRNLSYIIRRDSDGQVNNNTETMRGLGQSDHLNTTYNCARDEPFLSSPSDSNNSLHNISMEELHNMARLQEQSLRVTSTPKTLTRKDTQTILELPNIDERPRPPGRTSSTDTYCVVQSNPDSAESSGLSSPMDAQSYEDIQAADAVRRSMPNLALIKGVNGLRGPSLQLAPPMNSLKHKAHHISDSKLSHFMPRPTMEPRTSSIPNSTNMHYQNAKPKLSYQRPPMSYASSGAPLSNGSRIPNNNVRSGLPTPRYSSIPSREGNRPTTAPARSQLPTASSANSASCQPTFGKPQTGRVQSRIPAPGAIRNRMRTVGSARDGGSTKDNGDWRDGCY